jgi:hypothetical protein
MTKNLKLILIQILIIFIFVLLIPPLLIREKIIVDKSGAEASFNLSQNKYFLQNFSQHAVNIDSISLHLKNPQILNNALITVELIDSSGTIIKDFAFYGANVGDPSWVKLKFSPLNISEFQIKVFSEGDSRDLYLYVDKDSQLDLITTSYLPGFKNRFMGNINFQIKQISERSPWHNILYLSALLVFNTYLFKQSKPNSKKMVKIRQGR